MGRYEVNTPADNTEHFVTLFDTSYLPLGMALHRSLERHAQPFHLWIICMDERVEQQLARLALPHISLLPLREVETPELLAVKAGRTRGEYCWTLTPFASRFVFERMPDLPRVTYLDADLFFFDDPRQLLSELDASGKQVLMTEHAFAPEYDKGLPNGRFCVQFLTFCNAGLGRRVMEWWGERCLEWCFARSEDGKFGDQKYLDSWPELFADAVHIVQQRDRTLAPWNVRHVELQLGERMKPVCYHFHSLRIIAADKVLLYYRYRIGKRGLRLYGDYAEELRIICCELRQQGFEVPFIAPDRETWPLVRLIRRKLAGIIRYQKLT